MAVLYVSKWHLSDDGFLYIISAYNIVGTRQNRLNEAFLKLRSHGENLHI